MVMQDTSLEIKHFDQDIEGEFWDMLAEFSTAVDREYYERSIIRHIEGDLSIVLARLEGQLVGYCILNWKPKYLYFRKLGLPEVQDLNVLTLHRRQGIGRKLVEYCEQCAVEKNYEEIGIGVGLDSSFGSAQRLYVRLGYIPDGSGVCYDRAQVTAGEFRPIDDNLSLMMTKKLI